MSRNEKYKHRYYEPFDILSGAHAVVSPKQNHYNRVQANFTSKVVFVLFLFSKEKLSHIVALLVE